MSKQTWLEQDLRLKQLVASLVARFGTSRLVSSRIITNEFANSSKKFEKFKDKVIFLDKMERVSYETLVREPNLDD